MAVKSQNTILIQSLKKFQGEISSQSKDKYFIKMPQRRNNNSLIKKQKKLIENRLIQISMVVDDYIYQNKPISSCTAEMYMREVHYYNDKCFEDERSLQVIEKLIRFMKGIIAEQGEKGINVDDLNNLPSTTPIYNVLENLSQSTQNSKPSKPKSTKSVPNFRTYGNRNEKIYRDVKNTRGNGTKTERASISKDSVKLDLSMDSDPGYNRNFSQRTLDSKLSTVHVNKSGTNVKSYGNKNKKIYRYVINEIDKSQNIDIVDLCMDSDEEHNHKNIVESQNANDKIDKEALLQRDQPNLFINVDELTPNVILNELASNFPNELTPEVVSEECSQSLLTGFHQETEPISKLNKESSQKRIEVTHRQTVAQEIFTNNNKDSYVIPTQSHQYKELVNNNEKLHHEITTTMRDKSNINFNNEHNLETKVTTENLPPKNIRGSTTRNKRRKTAKINKTDQAKVRKPRTKKQNITNDTFSVEKSRNYPKNVVKTANIHNNSVTSILELPRNDQNNVEKTDNIKNISTFILEPSRNDHNKMDKAKNINTTYTLETSRNNQNKGDSKTKNISNKTKVATIYNNLIVNDLSWVENIRYVREVAKEEFESVTLGDNFWENFSLPDNWNDRDFLY